MRLWTIHPKYLDVQGLSGAWREALLAQKVLRGETKGYKNHPQLNRFKAHDKPLEAIAFYLRMIYNEACDRGYNFDASKIPEYGVMHDIEETYGQLQYEWNHLLKKLLNRSKPLYDRFNDESPIANPMFRIVKGGVRDWEKV